MKATYNTVDVVGNKIVFDVGGNKFRIIAVINYENHKVFIRFVLSHKEYDQGGWEKDTFGDNWKQREAGSLETGRQRREGTKKRRPRRKG